MKATQIFSSPEFDMPSKTLSRADIVNALYSEIGLSKTESAQIFESMIEHIVNRLVAGETVKISGFGTFEVRQKNKRPGRNPRTGEYATIDARRVVVFRSSEKLKKRVKILRH